MTQNTAEVAQMRLFPLKLVNVPFFQDLIKCPSVLGDCSKGLDLVLQHWDST